jgi:uncharacterized protein YyaL (SSP411 family)
MTTNQLINQKSPYLLQHAHNPVDWNAWSDEAFQKALKENKPIFLSIGYATCHWCHVMEKETFEDEEAAGYLNETFICIKVDREERPDIDAVYMAACQLLTGSGGWPLTIFMTPDKKPFFAGTYIPKRARFGNNGVIELCQAVKTMWQSESDKVLTSASNIAANLPRVFAFSADEEPDESLLDQAYNQVGENFNERFGGFERKPKFPTPHRLLFLLRCYHRTGDARALEMVKKTLTCMRLGGIWDHVGFGFHRYSTDMEWLLPHFEKMLYDQALIALAYLETYQITKDPLYSQTAREIFNYVLRDMTADNGGFYTAEDADSEGEEGKFYVWALEEFREVLGPEDTDRWEWFLNLKDDGNFFDEASGRKMKTNIFHLRRLPSEMSKDAGITEDEFYEKWEQIRQRLFQVREKRIHPLKDDKILTDWNGLMIAALARGGRLLDAPEYTEAAKNAAAFILSTMRKIDGRLFHRYRQGDLAIEAQASDFAFFIFGLLELYQATFDPTYLEEAITLQHYMLDDFWDREKGGFYSIAKDARELPVRPKELYDGAIPSANSVSLFNLLCLAKLTGKASWEEKAQEQVRAFAGTVKAQPEAFTFFLVGLDFALNPGQEVVITGEPEAVDTRELLSALDLNYTPNKVTLVKSDRYADQLANLAGYTDGLQVVQGKATAHVCRGHSCKDSTTDVETMVKQLLGKK